MDRNAILKSLKESGYDVSIVYPERFDKVNVCAVKGKTYYHVDGHSEIDALRKVKSMVMGEYTSK